LVLASFPIRSVKPYTDVDNLHPLTVPLPVLIIWAAWTICPRIPREVCIEFDATL